MTAWAIEFQACLQPVTTETVIDARACTALSDSASLPGAAWTDGTMWVDGDDLVGWEDWPPVAIPT